MRYNLMRCSKRPRLIGFSNEIRIIFQPKTPQTPLLVIFLLRWESMSISIRLGLWKGLQDLAILASKRSIIARPQEHNLITFGHLISIQRLEGSKRVSIRKISRSPSKGQKAQRSTICPRRPFLLMPLRWTTSYQTVQILIKKPLQGDTQICRTLTLRQETTATSSSRT